MTSWHKSDKADLIKELEELEAENKRLTKGIRAVEELFDESLGIYGLHMNGDPAPWDELRTGGCYEEWLIDFDTALDSLPTTTRGNCMSEVRYSMSIGQKYDGKSICLWRHEGVESTKIARFQNRLAAKLFAYEFNFPLSAELSEELSDTEMHPPKVSDDE